MADPVDSKQSQKPQRDRSPAYPFMSLKTSFERVAAFDAKFGRHGSPMNKAGIAWGYKGDSSQASQTLSALKYFGLVEYSGPTSDRVVALTDDARNYLRSQVPGTKAEIARACALRPKAMQTYWSRWGADRPIDEICLDQLVIKDNFTESAAKVFLRVYDETIAFAGLGESDKIPEGGSDADGLDNGGTPPPPAPLTPAPQFIPASQNPGVSREAVRATVPPPKGAGMRQEIFTVAEGDVTIQWPERLSADSLEDFKDWLHILERKITRSSLPREDVKPSQDVDKDDASLA